MNSKTGSSTDNCKIQPSVYIPCLNIKNLLFVSLHVIRSCFYWDTQKPFHLLCQELRSGIEFILNNLLCHIYTFELINSNYATWLSDVKEKWYQQTYTVKVNSQYPTYNQLAAPGIHLAFFKMNLLDLVSLLKVLLKTSFHPFPVWRRYYVKSKLNSNAQSIWNWMYAFVFSHIISFWGETQEIFHLYLGWQFDF